MSESETGGKLRSRGEAKEKVSVLIGGLTCRAEAAMSERWLPHFHVVDEPGRKQRKWWVGALLCFRVSCAVPAVLEGCGV